MKRLLVLVLLSLISTVKLKAQCTPDTSINTAGVYPDSATGLASAVVNMAYNQVIQIRVPLDTLATIVFGGIPFTVNVAIDSIQLNSFNGLPPGLSLSCSTPNCTYPGNSNGCALISGTPTDTGLFPITAILTAYAHPLGLPYSQSDTIQYYSIYVSSTTGLSETNANVFSVSQNAPNPVSDIASINYTIPRPSMVLFKLSNLIGKQVYQSTISALAGNNNYRLDTKDFAPGNYLYSVEFDNQIITKSMVIGN